MDIIELHNVHDVLLLLLSADPLGRAHLGETLPARLLKRISQTRPAARSVVAPLLEVPVHPGREPAEDPLRLRE